MNTHSLASSQLKHKCVAYTGNDNLDEMIQGCLRKKEKSQEMLYKRFFGYALRVALIHNRNRENALEIVNDSFVKVFNQIGRYDTDFPTQYAYVAAPLLQSVAIFGPWDRPLMEPRIWSSEEVNGTSAIPANSC